MNLINMFRTFFLTCYKYNVIWHVIDIAIVNRSAHINQSKERKTMPGARYTIVRLDLVFSEKSRSFLARSRSKKRPCRVTNGRTTLFPILDTVKSISLLPQPQPLLLAHGSLSRSVMKVLQVERAPAVRDNKAILLFITGRLIHIYKYTHLHTSRWPVNRQGMTDRVARGLTWSWTTRADERVEKWKRAEMRECERGAQEKSRRTIPSRRESYLHRPEEFVFLLSVRWSERDRYEGDVREPG